MKNNQKLPTYTFSSFSEEKARQDELQKEQADNAKTRLVIEGLIAGFNVYAENGNEQKFVNDFAKAWHKVMMLGRFDVQG